MGQTQSASLVVSREAPHGTEFSGRGAAVVTGATSGLGIPTTVAMLRAGFDLVFATARSPALATALRDEVAATLGAAHAARLKVVMLDFTDLRSVRAAAAQIDRDAGPAGVAVLCNNAGINTGNNELTTDGFERQIGVNHIAPVCFTDALLPALSRSGQLSGAQSPARIVFVSSNGHKWALGGAGFDETLWKTTDHSLGMWSRYGQSKLCNVLAALDYDATFQRDNVPIAAFSLHPGVVSTNIVRDYPMARVIRAAADAFVLTADQGAATQVSCALSKGALANRGGYFVPFGQASRASAQGCDSAAAAKLMAVTRRVIDEKLMSDAQE